MTRNCTKPSMSQFGNPSNQRNKLSPKSPLANITVNCTRRVRNRLESVSPVDPMERADAGAETASICTQRRLVSRWAAAAEEVKVTSWCATPTAAISPRGFAKFHFRRRQSLTALQSPVRDNRLPNFRELKDYLRDFWRFLSIIIFWILNDAEPFAMVLSSYTILSILKSVNCF